MLMREVWPLTLWPRNSSATPVKFSGSSVTKKSACRGTVPSQSRGGLPAAVDEGDPPAHHRGDGGADDGVVGAAQNEGVHPGLPDGGQVPLCYQAGHLVLGGDKGVLHQGHEQGAGLREHLELVVQLEQGLAVGVAVDGGVGADDPHLFVFRGGGSGPGGREHHVEVGHPQALADVPGGGAHRAAGGQHRLDPPFQEEGHVLLRVAAHGLSAAGAVGHPAGIAKIDDAFLGQQLFQLLHGSQAPQARVEHADGTVIHKAPPLTCRPSGRPGR